MIYSIVLENYGNNANHIYCHLNILSYLSMVKNNFLSPDPVRDPDHPRGGPSNGPYNTSCVKKSSQSEQ